MTAFTVYSERLAAIHLLRSGVSPKEVAQKLRRSLAWVYKWRQRFRSHLSWESLQDCSRAPKHHPNALSEEVRQAIRQARSELEAEAAQPGCLCYIGAHAVRTRLKRKYPRMKPPSISSIERTLSAAGMTRPRQTQAAPVRYPHLRPTRPHQLVQADILPRFLPGGPCVSCFNAIDVVSRYPVGTQSLTKRAEDAAQFLIHVWQEMGIPDFTQVDNESCLSGGTAHPGALGKVLRLALMVGTELVFTPFRHPESNGYVERFHQDYTRNVWNKADLQNLESVQQVSAAFFETYHQSSHHSALEGQSPAHVHQSVSRRRLPSTFTLPKALPLTAGKVHFIRLVNKDKHISILNMNWEVPTAQPYQGVWATLEFTTWGATLRVYDAAPDAPKRTCLAIYPFPLKENVQPPRQEHRESPTAPKWLTRLLAAAMRFLVQSRLPGWLSMML